MTIAGVIFIAALTWVCYRGIEVSARLQQALLAIELVTLGIFAVVAFVKAGTGHALPGAGHLSAAWLSPWTGSFRGLANSFLLAVFVYWGSSFDGIGGVFLIGAGSLAVGAALMVAARRWLPAFFTTGTLPPLPPLPEAGDEGAATARVLEPA